MDEMISIRRETVLSVEENARQMGEMILRMGKIIEAMQRRMDDLESRQEAVTVSHKDVNRLNGLIRSRAAELVDKNGLKKADETVLKGAIKKDVKRRYQVKDLHDLQARHLQGAERMIISWTNIRLIMERRTGK